MDHIFGTLFNSDDQEARLAAAKASLKRALSLRPQPPCLRPLPPRESSVPVMAARKRPLRNSNAPSSFDRNLAFAHSFIGNAKSVLGRSEETEAHVREAIRLSPRDAFAYVWMCHAGQAKIWLGADKEAVAWLRWSIEANPNFALTHFTLAAALAHLGRLDEARAAANAGRALDPTTTIQRFRTLYLGGNPVFMSQNDRVLEGMRIAGVPER